MEFNANVTQITEDTVTYEKDGRTIEIPNDYVFAMIGYHPDYNFLESIGIEINTNEYGTAPVYNRETYETNVENCYIAGVIAAMMLILSSLKMVNTTVALLHKVYLVKTNTT